MEIIDLKKKTFMIIVLSIIGCTILVSVGIVFNYKIAFGILIVLIFLTVYCININESYKIFFVLIPIIPLYLAIDISDSLPLISAYRLLYFFFIIDELIIKKKINKFIICIKTNKFTKIISFYIFCMSIATIVNFNSTSIVNLISIIIEQVVLYYIVCINIDDKNTVECIINILIKISLVLSIFGIVEYLISFNIFSLLDTSQRVVASHYVRMGNLRVSTSFKHSLGYGLYLVMFIPFVLYRMKTLSENKNTKKYIITIITLISMNINVILTSSRSTLLVLILQYCIIFMMTNWRKKIVTLISALVLGGTIIFMSLNNLGSEIPVISTIGDNIRVLANISIGNSSTDKFGENSEPFTYRNELIKYSFSKRGKDLIVGSGLGFIRENPLVFNIPELNPWEPIVSYSVDNYYVLKFLELGIIGLVSIVILFYTFLKNMFLNRSKSYLSKMILISTIGYLSHLFMVDELETIKYLWIIFAIFSSYLKITSYNNKILR